MLHVLHLVGSCEDARQYDLSVMYASACESSAEFQFTYAVISPDNKWLFTTDLDSLKHCEGENIKDMSDSEGETTTDSDGETTIDSEGETTTDSEGETTTRVLSRCTSSTKLDVSEALHHISRVVRPDVVLHHMFCHTGSIYYRCLMEMLNLPLVGCPSSIHNITKNKATTKAVLTHSGDKVLMPKGIIVTQRLIESNASAIVDHVRHDIQFPCVVKAATTEDSLGVFLVKTEDQLVQAICKGLALSDEVLIEKFIPGREVRCAVIEDQNGALHVLPITEYNVQKDNIRLHNIKLAYNEDGSPKKSALTKTVILKPSHHTGNQLNGHNNDRDDNMIKLIGDSSIEAFQILNLRDFGLFDFRVHEETGLPYLLEVNLFCSFGYESALNGMARAGGLSDKELLRMVLHRAAKRK